MIGILGSDWLRCTWSCDILTDDWSLSWVNSPWEKSLVSCDWWGEDTLSAGELSSIQDEGEGKGREKGSLSWGELSITASKEDQSQKYSNLVHGSTNKKNQC